MISANSNTNPHAVWRKSGLEHSAGVDVLATLNVWVPILPISTVLVSPTLYALKSPSCTAATNVSQSSVANDSGPVATPWFPPSPLTVPSTAVALILTVNVKFFAVVSLYVFFNVKVNFCVYKMDDDKNYLQKINK